MFEWQLRNVMVLVLGVIQLSISILCSDDVRYSN